jgi:hypothetical protein
MDTSSSNVNDWSSVLILLDSMDLYPEVEPEYVSINNDFIALSPSRKITASFGQQDRPCVNSFSAGSVTLLA